ncbi:MAG TPA: hypothetical protein VHE53_03025, partial [Patescibacteria group bacterium]|nr:hypothetical protein [Patescibacteria group bacterium]
AMIIVGLLLGYRYFHKANTKVKKAITKEQGENYSSSVKFGKPFEERWKSEIKIKGPKIAYQDLKKEYKNYKSPAQHVAAHLMGELLYDALGMEAIAICDSSFQYGCYHGVFISASVDKGADIASQLNTICLSSDLWVPACQHGIGHGLVEYYGNSKTGLLKALVKCDELVGNTAIAGCADGALMEYEFPSSDDPDDIRPQIREMVSNNPHEICNIVSGDLSRRSCYFSMPQWWFLTFKDGYKHVGQICETVKSDKEKEACFIGIGGDVVLRNNFDKERAMSVCNTMPNEDSRASCLHGAYWIITSLSPKTENSSSLCNVLNDDRKTECLAI